MLTIANEESGQASNDERIDWRRAHEELTHLAQSRARLDWEEGGALLRAIRAGAHRELGYATFTEYVERILGYSPRWTHERLRVAEALEQLPELGRALREGALSWSAVRELTRAAVPENELQWLRVAEGKTLRQIEELICGHEPGDAPGEPSGAAQRRHVLRFEVSAETYAAFREVMGKVYRDAGGPMEDDAALLLIARQVLGGPTDAGRAPYQLAITVCEDCRRAWQHGRGEAVRIGPEVVEMAQCDAQHIGRVHPGEPASVPAGDAVSLQPGEPASVQAGDAASLHPDEPASVPAGVSTSCIGNIDRETSAHVGRARARQDIPPAVRREVMHRDGGRCVVVGCQNAVWVDVHHIAPRSEGGQHAPQNLVVLCAAHHRAIHRGQLIIAGHAPTNLDFRHADGRRYGSAVDPIAAETHTLAFRALRGLGYREKEARSALDCVRAQAHVGSRSMPELLRAALSVLAHG